MHYPPCAEANASLISAAPELLKYLEMAVMIIQNEYPEEQWPDYSVPAMEAAIAKAKGELKCTIHHIGE